jgi:hypothetical protein
VNGAGPRDFVGLVIDDMIVMVERIVRRAGGGSASGSFLEGASICAPYTVQNQSGRIHVQLTGE